MQPKLTYPQWFALLSLRYFSPEKADRVLRRNTMDSLVRRGLAKRKGDLFSITRRGVAVEDSIERAPKS